jgi:hypothetical protein
LEAVYSGREAASHRTIIIEAVQNKGFVASPVSSYNRLSVSKLARSEEASRLKQLFITAALRL